MGMNKARAGRTPDWQRFLVFGAVMLIVGIALGYVLAISTRQPLPKSVDKCVVIQSRSRASERTHAIRSYVSISEFCAAMNRRGILDSDGSLRDDP